MRTPEEIIGADLLLQLEFEGYEVVRATGLLPTVPDRFDEFYAAYPRKVAKPAAKKAYAAAIKRGNKHDAMMAGVARLVASRPDPQYTPHPATWINQERWNDAPLLAPPTPVSAIDRAKESLRQRISDGQRSEGSGNTRYAGYLPSR